MSIKKLSEVAEISENMENPPAGIYHVLVDDPDIDPPKGCREIGLILKMDEDGEIDEDLLDVMIGYRQMSGIHVLLEVLAEDPMPEAERLAITCMNIDSNISLLPPEEDTDEAWKAYIDRVISFAPIFATKQNFTSEVFPLQSYAEYLFLDILDLADNYKPTDDYIIEYFASRVSKEREDQLKSAIREAMFEAVGGEDNYREFVFAAAGELFDQTEAAYRDRYNEIKRQLEQQKAEQEEQAQPEP